jgi:Transposase DDE domain
MKHKEKLEEILGGQLCWHKSRVIFTTCFILSLIQQKTVNLVSISQAFYSKAEPESSYRRIQRFFKGFRFKQDQVSQVVIGLLPKPPYTVCLDRTNWQFGSFKINILMLSIAHKGVAFPILWLLLGKKGNSNTQERKKLLRRLFKLIKVKDIAMLVADREFIGHDWFKFLNEHKIPFTIRIRQDALADASTNVHLLFKSLKVGHSKVLTQTYGIYGVDLYLCALRLDTQELLILVSNRKAKQALTFYKRRWQIEMLFAAMKKTGFDLETTHLACNKKIDKLLSLLSLALVWAHTVGEWLHRSRLKPLATKQHGRLAKSFFRHGLDYLRSLLCNPLAPRKKLLACVNLLSCT